MIQIAKPLEDSALMDRPSSEGDSGLGTLWTRRGCLPLKALDVQARLTGLTASTTIRQTFRNSLDEPLEATYIFPLPDRAAVRSFRLRVAGRVIEGELKERGEAREEYEKAIQAGNRAAIAEEERSGTFSLRVGNIPAKEEVSVELTLIGPVPVANGEATFRFPLVVAPRYVPGIPLDGPPVGLGWGSDTDAAPDASRVTPPVLLPGFPNPVCLSLEVQFDPAGLCDVGTEWTTQVRSSLHSVIVDEGPPWTIRLQPEERLNRDFILRFPVATGATQTTLICSSASQGEPGTFALTLVPPTMPAESQVKPRDVVIVLDRSGSMGGWKMVAARRAVGRMVDTLLEQDQFTILAFDNAIEYPEHAQERLVEASDRVRWRALEWLGRLEARGGTEMGPALQKAVGLLAAGRSGCERIVVLVTDGQVAGEDVVLRQVTSSAGASMPRIHALGIDQAVNEGFLRRLTSLGGGSCDLVESEDRLDAAMDQIHRAIGTPVLTGLQVDVVSGELIRDSLVPSRLPDLFADRPITIHGRFAGDASSIRLRVQGRDAAGRPWHEDAAGHLGLADVLTGLWGRAKVRELEDRYAAGSVSDPQALAKEIVEVSLASHVLSRFTAYVAVDRSEVVNPGGQQQEILQPVEMPAGWDVVRPYATLASRAAMSESVAECCLACSPEDLSMSRRSWSPAQAIRSFFGRRRARGGAPEPTLRDMSEIAVDIREAVHELVAILPEERQGPTDWSAPLDRLMRLLAEVAIAARRQMPTSLPEVERLLEAGRTLLAGFASGAGAAETTARLREYLEKVGTTLDAMTPGTSHQPPASRQRFWT